MSTSLGTILLATDGNEDATGPLAARKAPGFEVVAVGG